MDAVRSFFKKYNAVPADDSGPRYDLGPVEPVANQFKQLLEVYNMAWKKAVIAKESVRTPELVSMRKDLIAMAKALINRPKFGGLDEKTLEFVINDSLGLAKEATA